MNAEKKTFWEWYVQVANEVAEPLRQGLITVLALPFFMVGVLVRMGKELFQKGEKG